MRKIYHFLINFENIRMLNLFVLIEIVVLSIELTP